MLSARKKEKVTNKSRFLGNFSSGSSEQATKGIQSYTRSLSNVPPSHCGTVWSLDSKSSYRSEPIKAISEWFTVQHHLDLLQRVTNRPSSFSRTGLRDKRLCRSFDGNRTEVLAARLVVVRLGSVSCNRSVLTRTALECGTVWSLVSKSPPYSSWSILDPYECFEPHPAMIVESDFEQMVFSIRCAMWRTARQSVLMWSFHPRSVMCRQAECSKHRRNSACSRS